MRPPRLPRPLFVVLVAALAGCVSSGARWDRLQNLDRAARDAEPTCAAGTARVDARLWRGRVVRFARQPWTDRAAFRTVRQDLLRDLAAVRERACAWETGFVDHLAARVQAHTWPQVAARYGGADS
ncbi:MAG: hypothetical protein KIT14_07825 [bacterium]|nr:hypothetical protein [bacterium]